MTAAETTLPLSPADEPPRLKARHVAAVTAGNALEFYDFLTYAFFAAQIGRTFFPSHTALGSLLASLATFGVGFAMRPVGAFVIGVLGDGLVMSNVSSFWQMVIKGAVIVLAVIIDQVQARLQARIALQQQQEANEPALT